MAEVGSRLRLRWAKDGDAKAVRDKRTQQFLTLDAKLTSEVAAFKAMQKDLKVRRLHIELLKQRVRQDAQIELDQEGDAKEQADMMRAELTLKAKKHMQMADKKKRKAEELMIASGSAAASASHHKAQRVGDTAHAHPDVHTQSDDKADKLLLRRLAAHINGAAASRRSAGGFADDVDDPREEARHAAEDKEEAMQADEDEETSQDRRFAVPDESSEDFNPPESDGDDEEEYEGDSEED